MFGKFIRSLAIVVAVIFGLSVMAPAGSLAGTKGNPSDCAKIKDIDEKKECHEKALKELKDSKKKDKEKKVKKVKKEKKKKKGKK